MNITILGNGFLGNRIGEYLGANIDPRRIARIEDLENALPPDVLINTAGKTGRPNVDWCEEHKEETYFANVTLAKIFAEYAKQHHIKLVHFSSGCIYEGDNGGKGFAEEDTPNFEGSYYSYTKAEAERALKEYDNVLIIRPRMPMSAIPDPRNLLTKLLGYQKVISVQNSITIIEDLLPSLKGLIEGGHVGIFNMVNPEPVTHKEILELYEKYSGRILDKEYISLDKLPVKAPRSNTVLRSDKLQHTGFSMPHTRASLETIIQQYVALEKTAQTN